MNGDQTIMKCSWCKRYKIAGAWEIGRGCVTLQHDSIKSYATSGVHKHAMARWSCEMEKQAKPISLHVSEIDNANKNRVITTMKLMYFIAQRDFSLSSYEDLCSLAMTLSVLNMPKNIDYSSYTNRKAGNQFLLKFS